MSASPSRSRRRSVVAIQPAAEARQQPEALPLTTPEHCAVLLGRLLGLDASGAPLVDFPGNQAGRALVAHSSVEVAPADLGKSVMLVFINGDAKQPVVTGVLRGGRMPGSGPATGRSLAVRIDGDRLLLSAYQEVSLQCGKASVKLFRDGRVEVRGTNLLSRSSSVNRVKGGRVIIN